MSADPNTLSNLATQLRINSTDIERLEKKIDNFKQDVQKLETSLDKTLDACKGIADVYDGLHSFLRVLSFLERISLIIVKFSAAAAVVYAAYKYSVIVALKGTDGL